MLKRIGYRNIIDIYYSAILTIVYSLAILMPSSLILAFTTLYNVSLPIVLMFLFMISYEIFLFDIILKYSFSQRTGLIMWAVFSIIQILICLTNSRATITKWELIYA